MQHVMVDLETWGTKPGSALRSIGAVSFDPRSGLVYGQFYCNILFDEADGLTKDPDTVIWWSRQTHAAAAALDAGLEPLRDVLLDFSKWWAEQDTADGARFWCKGPSFDDALLSAAYDALGLPRPWRFTLSRDVRTVAELAGWPDIPFVGTAHYALDDCRHQIREVCEAYRILGLGNTPEPVNAADFI